MSNNQPQAVVLEHFDDQRLPTDRPDVTLTVTEHADGTLDFLVLDAQGVAAIHLPSRNVPKSEELWDDITSILNGAGLGLRKESEWQSVWLHWKNLGRQLYRRFVVGELQQRAQSWSSGMVISIESNEQWIPWELIYDGDEFWGKKFILARNPSLTDLDHLPSSHLNTRTERRVPIAKIVNIIGSNLLNENRIVSIDQKTLSLARRPFDEIGRQVFVEHFNRYDLNLDELKTAIAHADLIHFTCHGYRRPPYLEFSSSKSHKFEESLGRLYPHDVQGLGEIAESLVFANACNSGAPSRFLGETCNFGWEFYCKQVSAYIGTLGLVPTHYAIEFAYDFYQHLFRGEMIGYALHSAKESASRRNQNPFWLLYCLYGNPFARKSYLN